MHTERKWIEQEHKNTKVARNKDTYSSCIYSTFSSPNRTARTPRQASKGKRESIVRRRFMALIKRDALRCELWMWDIRINKVQKSNYRNLEMWHRRHLGIAINGFQKLNKILINVKIVKNKERWTAII